VFSPLQRYITRPNMKVGIIGIGGLGHMAVKFASKMQDGQVEVTAISQSSRKKEEALKMGARAFLDMSDKEAVKAAFRSFDFVLCTADGSSLAIAEWLTTIKFAGTFCMVGVPNEPISFHVWSLLAAQVKLDTSGIGSRKEIGEMLEFAAAHDVRPIIERMPMAEANAGLKKVRDGSVRFRVVLENPSKQ
jgi:alcohol dehydrogenase (NADP+)